MSIPMVLSILIVLVVTVLCYFAWRDEKWARWTLLAVIFFLLGVLIMEAVKAYEPAPRRRFSSSRSAMM